MVDVQIRFSAEILPFGFESEHKERLILDAPPPKYYTAFDFWEEETTEKPQIHEEKRENKEDSTQEKPQPAEIEVKQQNNNNNIENTDNQATQMEISADEQFYLQIQAEIDFDRQMELTMEEIYYDSCDEYEEDYEFAFFNAKKAYPNRLRNTSHYKKEKVNLDRCVNAYTQKREEQRTELIAQNHSFAKSNAFAKFGRLIPVPRAYAESTSATSNYTQYNRANNPNIPQSEMDLINQAIQASLRTQAAPVVANGLSANQLLELQTRDLTPEDYELLLALDESVKKKTLTKTQCASFPSRTVDEEGAKNLASNPCSICFCDYECGEKVRSLPCDHTFHSECIDQWLTTSAISCPLCKTSLEAFFEE